MSATLETILDARTAMLAGRIPREPSLVCRHALAAVGIRYDGVFLDDYCLQFTDLAEDSPSKTGTFGTPFGATFEEIVAARVAQAQEFAKHAGGAR